MITSDKERTMANKGEWTDGMELEEASLCVGKSAT